MICPEKSPPGGFSQDKRLVAANIQILCLETMAETLALRVKTIKPAEQEPENAE